MNTGYYVHTTLESYRLLYSKTTVIQLRKHYSTAILKDIVRLSTVILRFLPSACSRALQTIAIICLADRICYNLHTRRTTRTITSTIMAVLLIIFATVLAVQVVAAQDVTKASIPPVITYGNGQKICPSTEQRNIALQKVKDNVYQYLFNGSIVPQCGEGIWYRVVYLNMADSSQQCPSAWRLYSIDQYRACGRPVSGSQSSPATFYTTNRQYSKVCGRVIAFQ